MQTFFPSFKQYITKLNVDKHTNKLLPLLSHIQHLSTYQHVVVYIWHKLYTALNSTASVTILFHVDVSTFSRFHVVVLLLESKTTRTATTTKQNKNTHSNI